VEFRFQLTQEVDGALRFEGGIRPSLQEHEGARERQAGGGELEGGAASQKSVHRVFEMAPRGVRVRLGDGDPPRGAAGGGAERGGLHQRRDCGQLCEGRPRLFALAARRQRPHEQLQTGGAIGAILGRQAPQIAFSQLRGGARVAAIDGQLRASQQREGVRLGLVEQPRRVDEPSLPAPELTETDEGVGGHRRPARVELVGRRAQLLLRLEPRPSPHANRGVLRPAHREERPQAVLGAERLQAPAPLEGAVVVAHVIAARDHVAAGEADGDEVLHLAGDYGGVHFVEPAEALRDGARHHEGHALDGAAQHLHVGVADLARDADALGRERVRAVGVVVLEEAQRALPDVQPRAFRAGWMVLEQPASALQPAAGHGVLAAEGPVIPGQPDGDPGRAGGVIAFAVKAERPLARVEHDVREIQPPRRQAQPLERLRRFAGGERGVERRARLGPGCPREGRGARRAVVWE
jgi:hypothetical protein